MDAARKAAMRSMLEKFLDRRYESVRKVSLDNLDVNYQPLKRLASLA